MRIGSHSLRQYELLDCLRKKVQVKYSDSFANFYATNSTPVLRAVIAATAQTLHSEDATAEAFQRAWVRWPTLINHPAPAAWVVMTAVNLIRDGARRYQLGLRLLPKLARRAQYLPEPPIDPQLLAALLVLPNRQREVIALRILLDLSAEQTAFELDISVGTVGTHLSRGLTALRSSLLSSDLISKD
jgi:RNA polymerase sigma factor (sigma-70 family)